MRKNISGQACAEATAPYRRRSDMHGMMPPDPTARRASPAPALAEAGWAGFAPGSVSARLARKRTQAAPLPPPLLAGLVWLVDMAAAAAAGILLHGLSLTANRPPAGAILFVALLTPCIAGVAGAYAPPALFGGRRPVLAVLGALMASCGGLSLAAHVLHEGQALPAGVALLWMGLAAPLLLGGRLATAAALRAAAGRTQRRAVLVGDGPHATRLIAALAERQDRSLELLGVVDDHGAGAASAGRVRGGLPHLGSLESLLSMIRRDEVDEVILALPWSAEARMLRLLRLFRDCPVDVRLAPELVAYRDCRAGPPEAGGLFLPWLERRPISGVAGLAKTVEDYVLALIALAIAAVPMALIALAIRLDSPGPVLFRQRRTGFNGRDFHVLKFRTMYHEYADPEARCQVKEGDPRVTRIGAILRRTSLDELPQIFNVLRGEMSFVGPRPHAPGTLAGGRPFQEVVARYAARHRVKPGLTGLAQVRGWRGPTDTEEKLIRRVESDLEYIENWSLWLDFAILVRTLLVVARMRNAL